MTLNELIQSIAEYRWVLITAFAALPLAAYMTGLFHKGHKGPARSVGRLRYVYSVLVHAASVPGMFAAVITGYSLFFTRENLMEVDVFVYLLPLVSMVVTLILVRKNIEFEAIPGFDRLSGLMVLIGLSFVIAFVLYHMRIWVFFGGSIFMLLALAGFAFALLKWGAYSLFRRSDEPKRSLPVIGDD